MLTLNAACIVSLRTAFCFVLLFGLMGSVRAQTPDRVVVRGRVVKGPECTPLAGAVVDVWQANSKGRYDNDDLKNQPKADDFRLRGKVRCDDEGLFKFLTIMPGQYKIGPKRWRPAHLHVKVSAKGYDTLTTQLYFIGNPHNKKDPGFDSARALSPKKDEDGVLLASYEFVLAPSKAMIGSATSQPASQPADS